MHHLDLLLKKFLSLRIRLVHLDGLDESVLVRSPSDTDCILSRVEDISGEYWKFGGIRYLRPGMKLPSGGIVGIKR